MEATAAVSASWRTDPGLVRSQNEDFVSVYEPGTPEELARHGRLYIVADGVGGADAGEVASRYASERTLFHYLASEDQPDWGARLLDAMQAANTELRLLAAERDDSRPMATTMVAAVVSNGEAYIGNVGDSRAYLQRAGEIRQITRDQSLVARLLEEGAITEEEAARYPYKNVILYSLGSDRRPPIDLYVVTLAPGDVLLLCSDGLTRHVSDEEISAIVEQASPETSADTLVNLARERGGEDNITIALVCYGEPEPHAAEPLHEAVTTPIVVPVEVDRSRAPVTDDGRILWPVTFVLAAVMVVLIILLWYFIQQATAL